MTEPQPRPIPRDRPPASDAARDLIDSRDAEAEAGIERAVAQEGQEPAESDEAAADVVERHPAPEPPD